jgi:anti-sigma B factor antagonist
MAVEYEIRQVEPDVTVASLKGQLNLGSRPMDFEDGIKQRIRDGSRKMVLDLTALTYIDSAGLGMVATCASVMSKAGGKLVVVSAGGKISQMFQITHLNRVITISPTLDVALQAFSDPQDRPAE